MHTGEIMKCILLIHLLYISTSLCASDVCNIPKGRRFDCYPEPDSNKHGCLVRGCCWHPASNASKMDLPYCYYGNGNFGYKLYHVTDTPTGFSLDIHLHGPGSHYGGDVKKLKADFMFESYTRLHVKIYDATRKRYEVPIPTPDIKRKFAGDYDVKYTDYPFGFAVTRRLTGKVIFHTSVGGFIFADQFIQISSLLPSSNIYGLGEHVLPFKLSTEWMKLTAFARDVATPEGGYNLYGVHPFYLNVEDDGKANGVFLKNSNAMDIVLQPTPAITYRTIGGILDFYIFTGPTPAAVITEYTQVIGKAAMPPYWSLGFHLCRWGYGNLKNMTVVRERMLQNNIPQDTQWNDIDYMSGHLDFTIDEKRFDGLSQFVEKLHSDGMHYVMIVDPAIASKKDYKPFDDGVKQDIFIKDSSGDILIGQVWPGDTAFPDFFNPNTTVYWYNEIKRFRNKVKFDGLWIDMNEPSNFVQGSTKGCEKNKLDNPPFVPGVVGGVLAQKTICMNAQQHIGKHYDLHSLYGHSEAVATRIVLDKLLGKRSLVVTRSSYSGTGQYAAHWLGDNFSRWNDLYRSVSGILNFNLFGIPMVGADICGFMGETTEELCSRWMQLGAFYPFSRNHNSLHQRDQDPAAFGKQLIVASREALKVRYTLLPYLYTLFYQAHTTGTTVARPLFFEFFGDKKTFSIDSQFMWGSALLISPVLTQGAKSVHAYFPSAIWYEYFTGVGVARNGETVSLPASFERVNLHVREGYIIPTQEPALNTTYSRRNDFGLIVTLDKKGNAGGELFIDDGESFITDSSYSFVEFVCYQNQLSSVILRKGYIPPNQNLSHIKILGVSQKPKQVIANGKPVHATYDAPSEVLTMVGLKLSILQKISVQWIYHDTL